MSNSIIPIVTKVNPEDDHLNIETIRGDLEDIMNENLALYLTELQSSSSKDDKKKRSDPDYEIQITDADFD